jgi:acetolactate synthase I/III small subunit
MGNQVSSGFDSSISTGQEHQKPVRKRHLLSALVQNQPGVLAQVSGMFASRGFNIDSLAVGETEDPHLSRITVVSMGDDRHVEQVRKQLEKLIPVVAVLDISREDYVERDLMLIKVKATPSERQDLQSLVQIFRGRIVDVSPRQLMIEISGQEKKIEAFIEAVRPYGILELARTGRIALVRGTRRLDEDFHGEPPGTTSADADADEDATTIQGHSEL